ncbi:MAG TPA: SCO family protein [Candidatus Sulfomarinibacteraceae bacterium]|nr:SCO family protein [Candidatus Sulfomarinibacteraceae bacterium]
MAMIAPAVAGDGRQSPAVSSNQTARDYFTDLPLLTHRGEEVRFYSDVLAGKVVLITGFYTNCTTISPRQNIILSRLQTALGDRLGRDVVLVSITIDPKRDDVAAVGEYAEVFHPSDGWIFLTGKPENVDWVNYKLGQYLENVEDHTGSYLLGNLDTGLWKKAAAHAQVQDLYAEIERLLNDRGGERDD